MTNNSNNNANEVKRNLRSRHISMLWKKDWDIYLNPFYFIRFKFWNFFTISKYR